MDTVFVYFPGIVNSLGLSVLLSYGDDFPKYKDSCACAYWSIYTNTESCGKHNELTSGPSSLVYKQIVLSYIANETVTHVHTPVAASPQWH